jgi:hypothetical protein
MVWSSMVPTSAAALAAADAGALDATGLAVELAPVEALGLATSDAETGLAAAEAAPEPPAVLDAGAALAPEAAPELPAMLDAGATLELVPPLGAGAVLDGGPAWPQAARRRGIAAASRIGFIMATAVEQKTFLRRQLA